MKQFKFKQGVFASTYIYILLPMLVMIPLSVISIVSFNRFYTDSLRNQYTVKLESTCNNNEVALQSIANNIRFLDADETFVRTLMGGEGEADILHSISQLKQLGKNYPIIDSIDIVEWNSKKVYVTNGTFDVEDFFGGQYVYSAYNCDYWRNYKALCPKSKFCHLHMCTGRMA